MEELSKRYVPGDIEDKWYEHWMKAGHFRSIPDEREAYSIVIPPPNVTGQLHMGHILNNTIQDTLIRRARQEGKNACWVPGTDHASIATEAKVVNMLREKGIKKADLSREEFLKYAWEWTHKYGDIILHQLRKLGASCDWDRTAFTLDEVRSDAVIGAFVSLYQKGKLYRGKRMVNWDPSAKTVLSNEEVIYEEEKTTLYKVRYKIAGTEDEWITIATTRPETILGDTAIAVHPDDSRYSHLHGKKAIVPIINREVPIIADGYVDVAFGTGALKVTPAHDINDYEIGLRHGLEVIDVLNPDGSMSDAAQFFVGFDRDVARKAMFDTLSETGHIISTEELIHNVGRSERTRVVVEPRLSLQWFVDMKSIAAPALDSVMNGEIQFYPENLKNTYRHWMENIRDWCISRQLWWGHQIPAWYLGTDDAASAKADDHVFVGETIEEALIEARRITGRNDLQASDLRQDEDVLDTWFSSWLWPISVFDGWRNTKELEYYYPTNVLVTGWDIIFLWVARMIMAGYEWKDLKPFQSVYFTGMVRDKQRRKMSKQLGNSPDALGLIEEFGADGVRYGIMASAPAGGDILFDEKLCELGRNFCNKVWNALRLVKSWNVDDALPHDEGRALAIRWMTSRLNEVDAELRRNYSSFRLSEGITSLYSFVWDDFCSVFLEVIKPSYGEASDKVSYEATLVVFEEICKLLQPFMPFITEEIWHQLRARAEGDDCMVSLVSASSGPVDTDVTEVFNHILTVKSSVLELRNQYQLSPKESMVLIFPSDTELIRLWNTPGAEAVLHKLANATCAQGIGEGVTFLAGKYQYHAVLNIEVDKEAELKRLNEELTYFVGFVSSVEKKLSNEKFVANAHPDVVEKERQKKADGESKIEQLQKSIAQLN
ncbi:MAG: valine--tRNA ligase [Saprospiraceae bacterium]|nr:valine--tRNA ligase [Saprospiraceae bacterium]